MEGLIIHEQPEAKFPTMIVAFAGWPDAAESATRAIRYLVRKLPAKKFAEIDPEEFYDFTVVRPQVRLNRHGERKIRWPTNNFYYYLSEDESRRLILYIGTEPNLRWRNFSAIITSVAEQAGVEFVVSLGALLDAGLQPAALERELRKLDLPPWRLTTQRVMKGPIAALYAEFDIPDPNPPFGRDSLTISSPHTLPAQPHVREGRMAEQRVQIGLAAIVAANVMCYSRPHGRGRLERSHPAQGPPIRVWRRSRTDATAPVSATSGLEPSDKPLIAVFPFANITIVPEIRLGDHLQRLRSHARSAFSLR